MCVPKTLNNIVVLQADFLKHLVDVATVYLDLVCLSLFCFMSDRLDDEIRSLCGALAVVRLLVQTK